MSWESKGKRGEAPFRGHPPSSVDEHICNDIRSRLADDPGIDSSDIKVRVEDGQVLLEGSVPSEIARQMAEIVAYEAEGVRGVENSLVVRARKRFDTPLPLNRHDDGNPIEPGSGN
ncbi:MAG: BON domain-containing protein [Hyphomicrobiaceae bacterium]|jgi:osmotically-inducible protein OsmY